MKKAQRLGVTWVIARLNFTFHVVERTGRCIYFSTISGSPLHLVSVVVVVISKCCFRSYCSDHINAAELAESSQTVSTVQQSHRPRMNCKFIAKKQCSICQTGRVEMRMTALKVVRTSCCQLQDSDGNSTQFYRYYHFECVQASG